MFTVDLQKMGISLEHVGPFVVLTFPDGDQEHFTRAPSGYRVNEESHYIRYQGTIWTKADPPPAS